jgi:hypothetical protein
MQKKLSHSIDFNVDPFTRFTLCLSLLFLLSAFSQKLIAQATCSECDHYITPADAGGSTWLITWDAGPAFHNVQPGETVCFQNITYNYTVRIKNLIGSAAQRITIKNCGGRTIIDNESNFSEPNGYTALEFLNSKYFILRGDGHAGYTYGIQIKSNGHGLNLTGF